MNLTYDELVERCAVLEAQGAAARAEADALRLRVAELQQLVPPDTGDGVPVSEFKRRLAGVYYALGTKADDVQRRWDRVLALLDGFTVVYPAREPVAGLLLAAVGDGLLTADQAAALQG